MIPMVDVVFLLIIFFLVSSHMARTENEKLELPVAVSGDQEANVTLPRLVINIREDGQVVVAGRAVTLEALQSRLAVAREQLGDEIEVRIRCSKQAPYSQISPILLACTKNKIWNVSFAVYRSEF
ncbi:MAG TPA: biopolymer transporter ExbD [Pirellulaceae bacterium]|nr:biopolymer transporter ExbD [Pirellulaceae bacterium]HMO90750.1 biopolymer transporter ExbD [Pirellulaceae bacterium]HMP68001.1 biopolymer transporter ExbD [Pirellulaceae bacterium]